MSIKAIVVDDEPLARSRLKRMLIELDVQVVAEAGNGDQAIKLLPQYAVDMLFIDINMPVKNGLDTAKEIYQSVEHPPSIVFCTAYDEYAIEAFKTNASDYLLKPVTREDLAQVIERAGHLTRMQINNVKTQASQSDSMAIGFGQSIEHIEVSNVLCFRSVEKHVYADIEGRGEVLVDFTLKELEAKFDDSFIRCHRNALVNKAYLAKLDRDQGGKSFVHLNNSDHIFQVSRRHLTEVKKCFR